jgi:Ca2+/Na+ antiporter
LLAFGNTLADLFANASLSSLGYAVMACTGTISGQVFNLIIGLGLNMLMGSYR